MSGPQWNVNFEIGAYICEEGVDIDSILAHWKRDGLTREDLIYVNGGVEPDCSYGSVVYLPDGVLRYIDPARIEADNERFYNMAFENSRPDLGLYRPDEPQ